jgi:5-methylcytosine-specific restriction endonuclease McrA
MASAPARPLIAPGGRVLRDSAAWFSEGRARKRLARASHRCVECWSPLSSPRAEYCGPSCQWRFHGRYFWDAARVVVMRRDRYTCRSCGKRGRKRELEVDHILEIAEGGPSLDYDNLQTLCRPCHREKTVAFLRSRGRSAAPEWFPA